MNNWINGIPYEIAFWSSIYNNTKSRNKLFQWTQINCGINERLLNLDEFLFDKKQSTVLDVGCGMSFRTKFLLQGHEVNLHYIDPLADFFNKIAIKKKVNVPTIRFGILEYLSAFYAAETSPLIFIFNALDHSHDPIKGLFECFDVLTIGGVIYLQHHNNEAETESYRGFHQFNITIINEELIIWNKEKKYNVNELFADIAEVATAYTGNEPTAIIKKIKNNGNKSSYKNNDRLFLSESLMLLTQNLFSLPYVLKFNIKFKYYSLIHFFMQYFSFNFKTKIKSIIRKIKQ